MALNCKGSFCTEIMKNSYKIWRDTTEESLPNEVWERCIDAPDYEVSNLGRVRVTVNKFNKNGRHFWVNKIITQSYANENKTYLRTNLVVDNCVTMFSVHRLVATAFIPNPNNKSQVNHIDGVKTNNNVTNLEWVTPQENTDHAEQTGLRWYRKGEERPEAKLTEVDVYNILVKYFFNFKLQTELAAEFSMHPQYISLVTRGRRWKHVFERFVSDHEEHYNSVKDTIRKRNGSTSAKYTKILEGSFE